MQRWTAWSIVVVIDAGVGQRVASSLKCYYFFCTHKVDYYIIRGLFQECRFMLI